MATAREKEAYSKSQLFVEPDIDGDGWIKCSNCDTWISPKTHQYQTCIQVYWDCPNCGRGHSVDLYFRSRMKFVYALEEDQQCPTSP